MSKNSLCVIFNTLILRRKPKIGCNNTLLFISYLCWWINNNQLGTVNSFLWIIMNFFCLFLWRWWQGETIQYLILNLDLEYVLLWLIDDNGTSLWIAFNAISGFWSVSKILLNKSSWMENIHDQLKFHLDGLGYQLSNICIPLQIECIHHQLNIFSKNIYHK